MILYGHWTHTRARAHVRTHTDSGRYDDDDGDGNDGGDDGGGGNEAENAVHKTDCALLHQYCGAYTIMLQLSAFKKQLD